jgi:hypothetical protein
MASARECGLCHTVFANELWAGLCSDCHETVTFRWRP